MAHPLKAFRESQSPPLTQTELADLLGVSRASVSRWESGVRKPDDGLLQTITEKTGIDPGQLRPDLVRALQPLEGA